MVFRIELADEAKAALRRLRVDAIRVYYDVDDAAQLVVVLGIVPKSESTAWLAGQTGQGRTEDDR